MTTDGMTNSFPTLTDRETREEVAGNRCREFLRHAVHCTLEPCEVGEVRDDKYRVGFKFSAGYADVAACVFCSKQLPLHMSALYEHALLECPVLDAVPTERSTA